MAVARHTILATVEMAGPQDSSLAVHLSGMAEASIGVRVGRVLMYLHTSAAAARVAMAWSEARASALRLPLRASVLLERTPRLIEANVAHPSVVVHTAGVPPVVSQLICAQHREVPSGLSVAIGSIRFVVADQLAFTSCLSIFTQAAATAEVALAAAELHRPPLLRTAPEYAGQAAERAGEELAGQSGRFRWFGPPPIVPGAPAARQRRASEWFDAVSEPVARAAAAVGTSGSPRAAPGAGTPTPPPRPPRVPLLVSRTPLRTPPRGHRR